MRNLFLIAAVNMFATYTYTVTLSSTMEAIFVVTNALAAASWLALGILLYHCRRRFSARVALFGWIRPLSIALKIFCGVSFARCTVNNLAIWFPAVDPIQAGLYIANNICLAVACGYASVYYHRIPAFLDRVAGDAVVEIEEDGRIAHANPLAVKLFGYRYLSDLVGRKLSDFLSTREGRRMPLNLSEQSNSPLAPGAHLPAHVFISRPNGELISIDLTLTDYLIHGARRFVAVIRERINEAAAAK